MTPLEVVVLAGAGLAAGAINAIVGSGSLITFPTLLALGYPPVVANVSNTVGLVPGTLSGVVGYRRELAGQRRRVLTLGTAALAGGLTGGILLLALPPTSFQQVVPFLILGACLLVALQPRLASAMAHRRQNGAQHGAPLFVLIFLTGIYGGYFGAAQGVILIALLGIFLVDDLQRLNGLKNALALIINTIAATLFIAVAQVAWEVAVTIAVGSVIGGQLGALVGRRIPPATLRFVIVIVGTAVAVRMLVP